MQSRDGAAARATDAEALFEALCRVQTGTRANDAPQTSLARLRQELGEGPVAAEDAEDFPDFSADPEIPEALSGESAAPAATAHDAAGKDALMAGLLRTLGAYQGLLSRYNRDFDEVFGRRARGEERDDDATLQRLRAAQTVLVKYPVAAQAAFAALVREGRHFASTDEGRRWKERLSGSPLLARARTLFEGLAGGVVSEGAEALPSAYVDAFLRALDRDLEKVLAELGGVGTPP